MPISEAERIKLTNLASELPGVVRRDSKFVGLVKTILNFALAFEEDENKKLGATRSVDILKDLIGPEFLKGMSSQSYYRHIWMASMILRYKGVLSLVRRLIADYAQQKA